MMTVKTLSALFLTLSSIVLCASQRLSIINGKKVDITTVPYQCVLQYQGRFFCGASIISNCFAITAAHCTNEVKTSLSLRCGSKQYNEGGTVVNVKTVHQHELYNPGTFSFDYSILELATCLTFSSTIKPIKLPKTGVSAKPGVTCQVSGFGFDESGSVSLYLKAATVTIIDPNVCKTQYKDPKANFDITPQMICAGVNSRTKKANNSDACTGDSGGPLVCNGILEGCVSVGYGCGLADFPGVYSKVSAVISWIAKIANI